MLVDHFSQVFREEHRQVRDGLLDLMTAFFQRDTVRIQSLLGRIAALTGPHFRFEEETLYPALIEIFGPDYIESLLEDHDRAIGAAKRLVELAGENSLSDKDVNEAVTLVRGVLPHVSDCDGLSIMVERLSEQKVQDILEARDRSNQANVDLLRWADEIRKRPAAVPA